MCVGGGWQDRGSAGGRMTIALTEHPSRRLIQLLRSRHDDGEPPLWLRLSYRDGAMTLEIRRHDGSELSETERAHVSATLAATQ